MSEEGVEGVTGDATELEQEREPFLRGWCRRDDSVPFRHRFASWDRIISASVFATTPASAQAILRLRADSLPAHAQRGQEGKQQ